MAGKPNSKGMQPNGRSANGGRFTKLLHAIQQHPDYTALKPGARAFLWDMARQYNGHNNGNLTASLSTMGVLGYSKDQCARYRRQLQDSNWITVTRLPRAKKEPILYALSWLATDEWEGKPSLDIGAHERKPRSLR